MPDDENTSPDTQGSSEGGNSEGQNETTPLTVDNWREAIDTEYATDASLADIKDLNSLAKSYIHAQRMVGADKVSIPKEDWSQTDWDNFYSKLGRPETADHYQFEKDDNIPEGIKYNEEYEDEFKKQAHANGLNVKQANQLWNFMQKSAIDQDRNQVTSIQQKLQEGWSNLRKEWGMAYDQNIKLANKIAAVGGPEFMEWAKSKNLLQEPMIAKFAASIGKMISEDRIGKDDTHSSPVFSPREALSKINKIRGNPDDAFDDPSNPAYKDAVIEVESLYKMAYPDEQE